MLKYGWETYLQKITDTFCANSVYMLHTISVYMRDRGCLDRHEQLLPWVDQDSNIRSCARSNRKMMKKKKKNGWIYYCLISEHCLCD